MQGYQIWVDGILLATADSANEIGTVDGGDPIFVDGDLVLCGRSDFSSDRFFNGKIAHMAIFDYPLDNATVRRPG